MTTDYPPSVIADARQRLEEDDRAKAAALRLPHPGTVRFLNPGESAGTVDHELPDLDEFLAGDDEPYDWVIDGVIEAGDRIIVTGVEGGGKSTFLRQFAVQAASGIHPFTLERIPPVDVLIIDTENSKRQSRRALRGLRDTAGDLYQPGRLRLHVVGHSLELARPETYSDVATKVTRYQPRIIVIGPLYKLTDGDPIKEEPARALADALDYLREISDAALLIEAHTPYADGSKSKRPLRPYGASLWSRWPEFGVHLAPEGDITHWRGQRDQRAWPTRLERSTPWPWAPRQFTDPEPVAWNGPTECMAAIEHWFQQHPDREVGRNEMASELRDAGKSYRDRIIGDALRLLAANRRLGHRKGPRNSDLYRLEATDEPLTP